MTDSRHLGQLTAGEVAAVGGMDLPETAAGRLREMGFLTGASVRMVRRAPLAVRLSLRWAARGWHCGRRMRPKSSCSKFSSDVFDRTFALVGNPNTGKTTLFNAPIGLRQKVANYPGDG